jgi:hypothetical protein
MVLQGIAIPTTKKEPERKVVNLHSIETGKRLTQSANPSDIKFLTYNTWRTKWAV